MTRYSHASHRDAEREHCLRLVRAGSGWWPYVIRKAKDLGAALPSVHGDLLAWLRDQSALQGEGASQ